MERSLWQNAQYAGRGQRENTWHAQSGKNLTFSLLLKPLFYRHATILPYLSR
jgi:biotin-(acetyl-CoA carboxylase) ligase